MAKVKPKFSLGDRVRVSNDYWVEDLRGMIGTVTDPPEELVDFDPRWDDYFRVEKAGIFKRAPVYFIEFDLVGPFDVGDTRTDGAEMDEDGLEAI